ncbi:rod shape-determining protein MreD [Pontibacillus litoralis]|uniref:Cell shape-determining protein n=1 Tax=Pontibacillus litoralis JSM 072002 TaxID=1385512 RepID=A0A0A5GAJ4_9BACI|nr:rod shape-determining protein MreD [Pontibacillus litoralis]KGX89014.1 cell shape-determining protein [Pontibacillus litoralis JSM 072002]
MKRVYLPLLLIVIVVLEGTAMDFLPKEWLTSSFYFIPHWVLVVLVYVAIFYDYDSTYYCVLYGIIFGLLVDIVYTDMLGVYMFTYGLVLYSIHGLKRILHSNWLVTTLLTVVAVVCADVIVYVLYSIIRETDITWYTYVYKMLLPTLVANVVFALLLLPLLPRKLNDWAESHLEKSTSV